MANINEMIDYIKNRRNVNIDVQEAEDRRLKVDLNIRGYWNYKFDIDGSSDVVAICDFLESFGNHKKDNSKYQDFREIAESLGYGYDGYNDIEIENFEDVKEELGRYGMDVSVKNKKHPLENGGVKTLANITVTDRETSKRLFRITDVPEYYIISKNCIDSLLYWLQDKFEIEMDKMGKVFDIKWDIILKMEKWMESYGVTLDALAEKLKAEKSGYHIEHIKYEDPRFRGFFLFVITNGNKEKDMLVNLVDRGSGFYAFSDLVLQAHAMLNSKDQDEPTKKDLSKLLDMAGMIMEEAGQSSHR